MNRGRVGNGPFSGRAKECAELYLLMLPALVLIFIFCYIPIYGVLIAFQDYYPGRPILAFDGGVIWVGLKHFISFVESRVFWRLIRNTLVLSGLNLVFGFWVPIVFALVLNELQLPRYKKFVQTASYMPHFISNVVVAGMLFSFISTDGIVSVLRTKLGMEAVAFNVQPGAFPALYTFTNVWKTFGWNSILYLASIASIDQNLYEAARLDGAGRLQQMRYITLPSLKPIIMLMLIMAAGGIMNTNSDMILLLYTPATYETADVIGTYVYRETLLTGRFSYGAAVGLFTSVINFALVFVANAISRKTAEFSLW